MPPSDPESGSELIPPDVMDRLVNAVWNQIKVDPVPEYFGWQQSLIKIFWEHWYFAPLVVVPLALAWTSHFESEKWGNNTTFVLCFIAMIPLQKIFDWGGEEIGFFLGKELRDLFFITLSNAIEAALAIILLFKCQLRLLQATVVGVVLLHLLLVPGVAFFVQGSQIYEQQLHEYTSLNHSLLMVGVLGILVPTVFFAALDRGNVVAGSDEQSGLPAPFVPLVGDAVRRDIVLMSRGISVMLLIIYVAGRLYRHRLIHSPKSTPRGGNDISKQCTCTCCQRTSTNTPVQLNDIPTQSDNTPAEPHYYLHPWVCVVIVLITVPFMGVTAEFLIGSVEILLETSSIQTEWFGLVLLPIVSFSADATVSILRFLAAFYQSVSFTQDEAAVTPGRKPTADAAPPDPIAAGSNPSAEVPEQIPVGKSDDEKQISKKLHGPKTTLLELPWMSEFAHGRPIDLSIQFMLLWTPLLVLLGWWTQRPMHLLFDYFEVGLLLGACFLVNYVMSDGKTNISEGLTMIAFYVMIATAAWFYPGQPQVAFMLNCPGTVADAVAQGAEGTGHNLIVVG